MVDLFELFFDCEVYELFTSQTIQYAREKGNHTFTTTPDEIKVFIGIILISGYDVVPRRRMYWSYDADIHNNAISSGMSRDRFDEIQRYFHLCDNNNLTVEDKFSKVRPLLDLLNKKFLTHFIKQQNLCVDESMVPYYGRHGAKQFIRGKPIRFGYKMWVLATPLGFVLQFKPYQGALGRQSYPGLGMGGSVVFDLISNLSDDPYHITFDNLFTSLKLVDALSAKGITCTGTIRANRIENCPLNSVATVKKLPRGSFDYSYDSTVGLIVARWNDNNVVNVVSSHVGISPVQKVKRWSKQQAKKLEIEQPFLINHYNKTMGGVDRMDQNVSQYRSHIRSKKWWWPIFNYCLDLCVQQTWHLYRASEMSKEQPKDLLAIRRHIAQVYVKKSSHQVRGLGRPSVLSKRVPASLRLDGLNHLIKPSLTQIRCACCGMKTKHLCVKCQVGVHDRCFVTFHT